MTNHVGVAAIVLVLATISVVAFDLVGQRWAVESIPVEVSLGPAAGLLDGSADWDACAGQSLAAWNEALAPTTVRFTNVRGTLNSPAPFDLVNSIAFTDDVFGRPFGPSLLSVTQSFASVRDGLDATFEADVLINRSQPFNCYRGAQRPGPSVHDLQRTVTHALGHVIGLGHPDAAGQDVTALMNAWLGDVDTLQLNDLQGALTLAGVAMAGIPFPPRNEALTFYESLEVEYRDSLQRSQTNEGYVNAEGSAVWFPEWLRYVLNGCAATEATTRVLMQIRGQGIQPVCSDVASDSYAFPPRNLSLDFLEVLDAFYRDELQRRVELSHVDLEGKAVWLQEYLRYRVDGVNDADARAQVLTQIQEAAPDSTWPPTSDPTWPEDIGSSHFGQLVGGSDPKNDWIIDFDGAWVRPHPGPYIWGTIETTPGAYSWRALDRFVANAQSLRVAQLTTIWPFARWDQESCHGDQPVAQNGFPEFGDRLYAPCDMDAYLAWLGSVVERYDGDGVDDMPGLEYGLKHWEILNEPGMQGPELTFFQDSAEDYLELLKLSYTTIKNADPDATVLPAGQAGMQLTFVEFWEPVLSGAQGFFDIGNIHSISSSDDFFAAEYRTWLDSLGYRSTHYWVTEALVGRMVVPGETALNEDELAQLTFTGYASAFGSGANVIFNVGAHDPTGGPGQASADTFRLMAQTIPDFTSATRLTESSISFEMPDGSVVYALWSGASLPDDVTGIVQVTTYTGTTILVDSKDIDSSKPVFVSSNP